MASQYMIAPGYNLALGALTLFKPQCQSPGMKATRRDVSGTGTVIDQGLYVELIWPVLSQSAFNAIMTACGFSGLLYKQVTLYCRDATYTYGRYNGVAVARVASWQNS